LIFVKFFLILDIRLLCDINLISGYHAYLKDVIKMLFRHACCLGIYMYIYMQQQDKK